MCSISDNPVVNLPGLGQLRGSTTTCAWSGRKIYQFLGVKYAETPIGELRFKTPVPISPWEGVRDATKYGRPCPSIDNILSMSLDDVTPELEDCINLCVYTKDLSVPKPVMVYVHGGGYFSGSASQHPPNYVLEKDIVLVVPQYRLGPLGFLSTMSDEIPGNAGILDINLAFEWVQKYIEYFGGDPKNVTGWGQSAGATTLSILMYSDLPRDDLFSKVILQSCSSFTACYDYNCIDNAQDIAQRAGYKGNGSITELNNFFMNVDAKTLVEAQANHIMTNCANGSNIISGQRIIIGGPSNLLSATTYELMRQGKGRKNLPMLAGVTKHDGSFLLCLVYNILKNMTVFENKKWNQFELIHTVNKILGLDEQSGTMAAYTSMVLWDIEDIKNGDFFALLDGLIDLCGVSIIKAPILREVQCQLYRNNPSTFLYTFDYEGEHTRFGYGEDTSKFPFEGGISHSNDNLYLFPWPQTAAKLNEKDTKIAQKMVDLWTSFAINGVPTSPQIENWPPMDNLCGPYLHINQECTVADNFYDEFKVAAKEKRKIEKEDKINSF
ncbi:Carboxylic ester hydrolase [Sergentomyia squamirostris]